jgi:hypothetical protein
MRGRAEMGGINDASSFRYSAGQSKSTILIVPELDFFRANGYQNRSQEG